MSKKKVVVLPCSGIGKAYGEIGRQAVYELVEDLRPEEVATTCLARLVIDDPEAKALVSDNIVITVDGCTQDCARKSVESTGKKVDGSGNRSPDFDGINPFRDLVPLSRDQGSGSARPARAASLHPRRWSGRSPRTRRRRCGSDKV